MLDKLCRAGAGAMTSTFPAAAVPFNPFSAYATLDPNLATCSDIGAACIVNDSVAKYCDA